MDDSARGFGLTDGGYYFAISDKMDLKLRGDIFTKGSWALNAETNYNVRYKFSGLFQASYQVTKTGDKGLEDYMVAKDFKLFDDMDEWKEKVKFPPLDFMPIEDIFKGMCHGMHVNPETDVVSCLLLSGQFERMNQMIGMENALCAFYEYPDEVHEFFDAMCEYKLKCIDLAYKYLKPDVIHMHDDWGTNDNMFFSPDIWREFIKPNEKKYADHIHELGMLYMHHSCGYIQQIIPDLVEIGIDCIEPVMVKNDVDYILENFGDKITVAGGLDNQKMEAPGSTEEEIRQEIRNRMDRYVNKGRYIPYYIPTDEKKFGIYVDEVNKYGRTIKLK